LEDFHSPIAASVNKPDLVKITDKDIFVNNLYIQGSVVIFKKGK